MIIKTYPVRDGGLTKLNCVIGYIVQSILCIPGQNVSVFCYCSPGLPIKGGRLDYWGNPRNYE